MENSRRQFLKNSAIAAIAAGVMPETLVAANNKILKGSESCYPTTLDYYGLGPFYTAGAPVISNNQLAGTSEPGTRLILSGQVRNLDCSLVIANASIDIWHANDAGQYDTSGYNLRGITFSNGQGFYLFETILPGKYLNGSKYRPRHIHVKITPPGFSTIITQLYFQGDTDIPGDAAASITSGTYDASHRIIPISLNPNGKYEGTLDIVVDGNGVTTGDLHGDKGIIYSVSPNPFHGRVEISYGVFNPSKATIEVYDINGSMIARLDELELQPQKYVAYWEAPADLSPGAYFVTLKINDLQVHYLKIVRSY
jgi:protocatechuate 3,4-dioxygenase beta subunit